MFTSLSTPRQTPQELALGTTGVPTYGVPRLVLLGAFILAAGVDVRTSDVGVGGPASNPLEVLSFAALLLLFADTVIHRYLPFEILRSAWKSNPLLFLYAGWTLIAGVIGVLKFPLSLFVFRNLFPAYLFAFYLAFCARRPGDLRMVLIVLLVASLPNLLLASSQFFTGGPFPVPMNAASAVKMDVDGSFVRSAVSGLFNHPNGLSIFLLPVFLTALGLALLKGNGSFWLRTFSFFVAVAAAALLYATRAKGAWAWGALGVAFLFAPAQLLAFRRAWVYHVLVVVLLITAMVLASLYLGGAFKTMQTRIYLWESAAYAIANSGFAAVFGSAQQDVWQASAKLADLQYANAHNVFLNQVVYFGIPAALFYSGAFIWAIRKAQLALASSEDTNIRMAARISLATLLAVAGQYFFEPAAEASGLALECFLFMGVACASAQIASAK